MSDADRRSTLDEPIEIVDHDPRWLESGGVRNALQSLEYEYLGEAGVPGREFFRRRRGRATNVAAVQHRGRLWNDNVLLRDYLRAYPAVAAGYARAKKQAWRRGDRTLLAYSEAKAAEMTALLEGARRWRGGQRDE